MNDLAEIIARAHFEGHESGPCDLTPSALERIADAVAVLLVEARAEGERALVARVAALTDDYRNHYEMHGAAGEDYVVEDGRCVDVDDIRVALAGEDTLDTPTTKESA